MNKNTTNIIIPTLLILIGFLSFVYFQDKTDLDQTVNLQAAELSGEEATEYWSKRIDEIGTEKAYEEFKKVFAVAHFGIQHTAAHIFGELIYEKEGLDGFVICDETFAFGCYHSFFGQALSQSGTEIIATLDQTCVKKFGPFGTGCQHGIGHGLMEYYGPSRLMDALTACNATTQKIPIFGCTSGVFMEYNVPIMISDDKAWTETRPINKDQPYEPCLSLPDKYQESCFFELAQWWDKPPAFFRDYKKIGELCLAVTNERNKKSCLLGTGNVAAPSSDYNVALTIEKCQQITDKHGEMICRASAMWSFKAEDEKLAPKICEGLEPVWKEKCLDESDLMKGYL